MLPQTTKAAVLYEPNGSLEICDVQIPDLLAGQVLVKVFYSGICRSQLMEVTGKRGPDPWLPHLLGHEGCGEVVATGDGVIKVTPGDKVILSWLRGTGMDAPGAVYECNGEKINSGRVTTFSQYTVVSESRTVPLPEGVPMKIGVLFGCALLTGAGIVLNEMAPKPDETVAVIGLGGIGLSALIALKIRKVKRIIAIDISEDRLEMAEHFGATDTVNAATEKVRAWCKSHFPMGIDGCVEAAGSVETIELGFDLIKKGGGCLYFASHPPNDQKISLSPHDLISGKRIFGSWGGGCKLDQDVPKIAAEYMQGKMPLEDLVRQEYPLDKINVALRDLENGSVFRPIIVMGHT